MCGKEPLKIAVFVFLNLSIFRLHISMEIAFWHVIYEFDVPESMIKMMSKPYGKIP
jgi:hypothetical protein